MIRRALVALVLALVASVALAATYYPVPTWTGGFPYDSNAVGSPLSVTSVSVEHSFGCTTNDPDTPDANSCDATVYAEIVNQAGTTVASCTAIVTGSIWAAYMGGNDQPYSGGCSLAYAMTAADHFRLRLTVSVNDATGTGTDITGSGGTFAVATVDAPAQPIVFTN